MDEKRAVTERLGLHEENDHVDHLLRCVEELSIKQAKQVIRNACIDHRNDPNFPQSITDLAPQCQDNDDTVESSPDDAFNLRLEAALIKHHSPYPEVRAVTDPIDDVTTPVESPRSYILGLLWVIIGTAVNQFFSTRQPTIGVSAPLLQLLIYPCGKLIQRIKFLGKGDWNAKEQTLATIMFNITLGLPYVSTQLFVQKLDIYYGNEWATFGYQLCLTLSTQLLGFGIAGLVRRALVYPKQSIWLGNLPTLALNRALLKPESLNNQVINGWSISRYRFFLVVFAGSACYYWLPDCAFTALSNFNWMTWISPRDIKLNMVTGMYGLGINPLPTLDWNIINSTQCLVTPFFSYANHFAGTIVTGAVLIPILYWSNVKWSQYLPINSNRLFTNTGKIFNVREILSGNGTFDEEKYRRYSPPYYSAASMVVYGTFFAYYPASIVYSLLYHRDVIVHGTKDAIVSLFWWKKGRSTAFEQQDDAHFQMMQSYKETPNWWYMVVLAISIALAIITVKCWPTQTPAWGIFMSLALGVVFLIPVGLMQAITNLSIGLNVLTELIAGYALPGNGTAMMIIKAFGFNTNAQALHFVSDLKLGHYAKLPPRAVFRAQIIATLISALVTIGVANWQMTYYSGICQPDQPQRFTCPGETTYFSASIVWGVIGPKRVFDGLYPLMKYCFLIGVFIPLPFYLLERLTTIKLFKSAHPLVFMAGMLSYAPYSMAFHTMGFYCCSLSRYIKSRYPMWWDKYNYILACALDSGVATAAVIIFFSVSYHNADPIWWGNTISRSGFDGSPMDQVPLKTLKEGSMFGPSG